MKHPLQPFLCNHAQVLILGSFPPEINKWSMDFYYPNFINDFWRIIGIVFFEDKNHFLSTDYKSFDLIKIKDFLLQKGIAMADAAQEVNRLKKNASDEFLQVLSTLEFEKVLKQIPSCKAIICTGNKSHEIVQGYFGEHIVINDKEISLYKAPSSSRAYPLSLDKKALAYKEIFAKIF